MDFGDILDQWDQVRKRGVRSDKKPESDKSVSRPGAARKETPKPDTARPAKAPVPVSQAREAQQRWMARHETFDKDADLSAFREATLHKHLSRREIDAMPYDAVLDLHGMTALAAEEALERFFFSATARNLRKVLLIHGKGIHSRGGPVLADIVHRWLERHPAAGRSGQAESEDGGSGATWVLLKPAQKER